MGSKNAVWTRRLKYLTWERRHPYQGRCGIQHWSCSLVVSRKTAGMQDGCCPRNE